MNTLEALFTHVGSDGELISLLPISTDVWEIDSLRIKVINSGYVHGKVDICQLSEMFGSRRELEIINLKYAALWKAILGYKWNLIINHYQTMRSDRRRWIVKMLLDFLIIVEGEYEFDSDLMKKAYGDINEMVYATHLWRYREETFPTYGENKYKHFMLVENFSRLFSKGFDYRNHSLISEPGRFMPEFWRIMTKVRA